MKPYRTYSTDYQTEIGTITITYSNVGDVTIRVNGEVIHVPYTWTSQSSRTIIRKVCTALKNLAAIKEGV